jgi:TonB family protein
VIVGVKLLATGIPTEVVVFRTSGNERLDRAATDAVKGWTFEPATDESGKPLPGQFTVALKFVLEADNRAPISPLVTLTCGQAVSLEDEKSSDAEKSLRARSLALMREGHPRAEQLVAIDRAFATAYDQTIATCRNSSSEVFLRILIGALVAAGV